MTLAPLGFTVDTSPVARAVVDLDKLVPATTRASKASDELGKAATDAARATGSATAEMSARLMKAANDAENMAARINRSMRIGMGGDSAARGRDLIEYGRNLDALRAKFNPLYAEVARYRSVQADIQSAHRVGAISVNEMTTALDRERRAALENIAALKGRAAAIRETGRVSPPSSGGGHFNSANIGFQLQDIAVTSQMGMNPMMIALQQGTQLSAELNNITASGQKIGPALVGAFTSVLNPVSLVTLGVVGVGAAIIQMAMEGMKGAKSLDEAFKQHEATLDRIDARYAGFSDRLVQYQESNASLRANAETNLRDMDAAAKAENQRIIDALIPMREYDPRSDTVRARVATQFKPFEDAILALDRAIASGEPNLKSFMDEINRKIEAHPEARVFGNEIIALSEGGQKAQHALGEARQTVDDLGKAAQGKLADMVAFNQALRDLSGIAMPAMSDMDRADERYRAAIGQADSIGALRAADAEYSAARTRIQNQIAGSQVPIPTARPNDIEIWDDRTEAAEKAAKEAEKLAKEREREEQQRARARQPYENMVSGQRDQLELLRAEAGLLGQSEQARARVISSLQVEQQIRRLNIPLYGSEAQALRANASEIIQLTEDRAQAMKRMAEVERDWSENRDIAKGFMTDLTDGLRDGTSLWKSFADAALSALNRITDKLLDRAFEGILDAFMPKPGGSSGGGGFTPTIGGFASMIFGAGGQNGGGANDNYAPGAVTRAPLSGATDAQSQVWNFFANRGLAPHQVAGVMGHVGQESAFNPSAIGDAGKAFGLFQHHAARGGGQGLLGKGLNGQLEHAWSELQSTEKGTLNRLMASTDVRSATAAFGGFERPSGYSAANPEGMHGWSNRLNGAQEALKKFGTSVETSTASATGALDQLTTGSIDATQGVSQFGNTLANAFPAAPSGGGGGGIGGFLGSLFGGFGAMGDGKGFGNSSFGAASLISPGAANFLNGGGAAFTFSDGGYTGDGGVYDPAGTVHKGEVVWSQRDIAGAGGVSNVERMRKSGGRAGSGSGSMTYAPVSHITIGDNAGVTKADVEAIVQDNNKRQAEAFEKKQANSWRWD